MQHELIAFLEGTGTNSRGRKLTEIHGWPDARLESSHDYIQWVFPNRSTSFFNPSAPTLDDETITELKRRPAAMANVRRMLMRMYVFYDFEVSRFDDGTYQLGMPTANPKPWWVRPGNHNYLRLTRILLALGDLGLMEDLHALSDMLDVLSKKFRLHIGEKTIAFWSDAGQLPEPH